MTKPPVTSPLLIKSNKTNNPRGKQIEEKQIQNQQLSSLTSFVFSVQALCFFYLSPKITPLKISTILLLSGPLGRTTTTTITAHFTDSENGRRQRVLMEAQEFGDVDEANFAIDGLKRGSQVRIRRARFLSMICGTGGRMDTTGIVRKIGGIFTKNLRDSGRLDAVFEVIMNCYSVMELGQQ